MSAPTRLDKAHAAMQAGGEAERLRFYDAFCDAPLVLWLEREAEGAVAEPKVFDLEDGRFVLAFDSDERLAAFVGSVVPVISLPGRALIEMIAGSDLGIGLNLDTPSATMIPADAVLWLQDVLEANGTGAISDREQSKRPTSFKAPKVPGDLREALASKLTNAAGRFAQAILAEAVYDDGSEALLLAFIGATDRDRPALSGMVRQVLAFSHQEYQLDVVFLDASAQAVEALSRVGNILKLPDVAAPPSAPQAPGTDPDRPPKLR